ncbi:hypothetical protein IAP91_16815 [Leuconostoc mesenteroides]|nr:hypothetical protein [Leuconostoc mesenteroides]
MRKILYRYNWVFTILICLLAVINLLTLFKYPGSLLAFVSSGLLSIVSMLSLFGLSYKKSSHEDSQN